LEFAEKLASSVTPAGTGMQNVLKRLDSRSLLNICRDKLRGNDNKRPKRAFSVSCLAINIVAFLEHFLLMRPDHP
jgi:hypothetical protein